MLERQPGDPLDVIRARIARGNWQDLLKGAVSLPGERRVERLVTNTSSPAIPETVISAEQVQILNTKVSQIRRWLVEYGHPGTEHPDYEARINDKTFTPEELEHLHWYDNPPYEAETTEDEQPFIIPKPALVLIVNDASRHSLIVIEFAHSGDYELIIEFASTDDPNTVTESSENDPLSDRLIETGIMDQTVAVQAKKEIDDAIKAAIATGRNPFIEDSYNSAVRPLAEMTDEEYAVIIKYLDQFIQTQFVPPYW